MTDKNRALVPVILSGGAGTRLWPLSRKGYPKQFLPLLGDETMLQATVRRMQGVGGVASPVVVCNEVHRFLVAEQLLEAGISDASILLEPAARNTAPAVALAALRAMEHAGGTAPLLLVLPADHAVADSAAFRRAVQEGAEAAAAGRLVTFGVVPTSPETGFGYIRFAAGSNDDPGPVQPVAEFVEKPDQQTAEAYLNSGEYLWNSGMFLFRADRYLEELDRWAPAIMAACRSAMDAAVADCDFVRPGPQAFADCPADSIDYAVMERTGAASVVPLDAGWSDIGSWSALQEVEEPDARGNVVVGDVVLEDTCNSYLRAEGRLIAAVGVADHVVVETPDAVLVAHRDRVQDVKKAVESLQQAGREEAVFHKRVHRPWGWYEGLARGERFQVKRIMVRPGAALSRQLHHHRAEHWVVVKGTARVLSDSEEILLGEDQSTYIPIGSEHRLENPGLIPLEVIEVQTGSYLGEDDIIRLGDAYGRS